jgi:hypothetical protein
LAQTAEKTSPQPMVARSTLICVVEFTQPLPSGEGGAHAVRLAAAPPPTDPVRAACRMAMVELTSVPEGA